MESSQKICQPTDLRQAVLRKLVRARGKALWPILFGLTLLAAVSPTGAQQFTDVSTATGLVQEAKKSWGNPIWGDMNNDGFLDLIVPTHGLASSLGPFVYLNDAGNTFIDIRATSGIMVGPELDSRDWHGISFGDYNGDGNLDVYVSEGAKGEENKRDLSLALPPAGKVRKVG